MKIRFAVAPGGAVGPNSSYGPFVEGLEARAFDTVWLSDVPMGASIDPGLGLAFAAARTSRLKLGANVVPLGRNPFLLARELAQLDRLSNGRLLLSFVPGLDQPAERETLGIGRADRGRFIDEVVPLIRRWWAGEAVSHRSERFDFPGVKLPALPVQDPLEIWIGGIGPRALERAGRLADGWLGAAVTPAEAGVARATIDEAAAGAGRKIDPEHFGMSVGYAREDPPGTAYAALRQRRPDVDPATLLPVGREGLRRMIHALVENGISKIVLRPVRESGSVEEELDWLAEAVLDLQT